MSEEKPQCAEEIEPMSEDDREHVEDTANRLEDLAMALSFYDPRMAKEALAAALGSLCGEFPEVYPCSHVSAELVELHAMNVAAKQIEAEEKAVKEGNN